MQATSSPPLSASLMTTTCRRSLTASSLFYWKLSSSMGPPTFTSCLASSRPTRTTLRQRDKRQHSPSPRFYPLTTIQYRPTPPPPHAEGWRQREQRRSTIVTCMMSPTPDVDPSSSWPLMKCGIANCATLTQYNPRSPPSISWHTYAPCAPFFMISTQLRLCR